MVISKGKNMAKVESYDQVSSAPTNKVSAAGIGGSISVVLLWGARQFFGVEIPQEVAAAVATVISFASAYLVREKRVV